MYFIKKKSRLHMVELLHAPKHLKRLQMRKDL